MWDDLVAWFQSAGGARVLQTAIIPALAILVAGLLAAAIARSAVRATIRRADRVEATAAVAGLVAAARAAIDAEGDVVSRRRASRLQAEADVRVRLLPIAGADLAAAWAAAGIDGLPRAGSAEAASAELAELRDRLVAWVGKPGRARRLFAVPIAADRRAAPEAPAATAPPAAPEAPAVPVAPAPEAVAPEREPESSSTPRQEPPVAPIEQDRFARPQSQPASQRTAPAPEPALEPAAAAAAEPELVGAAPVAASAPPVAPVADALPAWQRTRAVERLQQERGRTRGIEPPSAEDEPVLSTAPVMVPRTHRADAAAAASAATPTAEADEAVRLEAHQQARHARPGDQGSAPTGAVPAVPHTPAPAWLDTYDDEAQVTQNLDLKTPPPVAASAVRDRGTPGEDLVPRS